MPADITIVWPEEPQVPVSLVEEAQRRLRHRGLYEGAVDGLLSAETRIAFVRLQRQSGLRITGTLDRETAAVLGLGLPGAPGALPFAPAPPVGATELPGASALLAAGQEGPLPQPPFDALAEPRARAAALLREASQRAGAELQRAQGLLGGGEALRQGERSMGDAQAEVAGAREEAFQIMVAARREGGWALLPTSMIARLEQELASRSLLLAPPNGRIDPDDEAAIRWLERSLGLQPTGQPSAPLFDALGIDTAPLFEE